MSAISDHPLSILFLLTLFIPAGLEVLRHLLMLESTEYGVLNWSHGPHQGDKGTGFVAQIGKEEFLVHFSCFALLPQVSEFPL